MTQVTWTNDRGGSGTANGTTSWFQTVSLQSGTNLLSVTAHDAAGNTGTDTLTVTFTPPDTQVPTVTIATPTSSSTHAASTDFVVLGGTASDNVGVTQVTWTNDRGGSGTASGTTSWSAVIFLLEGPNVLTVTAHDAGGNTATDTLTVTLISLHLWGWTSSSGAYATYLGCLTCSRFTPSSVHNQFGVYGSQFSVTSVWNNFGTYGGQFGSSSACNSFAVTPPVVFDFTGTIFFGELTVNGFRVAQIAEYVPWLTSAVLDPFALSTGPVCN